MTDRLVIKNTTMVFDDRLFEGDLLVERGRISQIGGEIASSGVREIDGEGLHLLPGVIDAHVHFREPGMTHKESLGSGSAAAARGGVTAFIEMPNTKPETISQDRVDEKIALAKESAFVHFGFYVGATVDNLEVLKTVRNVAGIKIFVGSSTGNMLVDDQETLEAIFRETALTICVHAEDEAMVQANFRRTMGSTDPATHSLVRNPEAAARSVARLSKLAVKYNHRLHLLHQSTQAELSACIDSPIITAEVCYPHLFLDTDAYESLGCLAKINPALRSPEEPLAMWEAIRAGKIDTIGSDHAPHTLEEKEMGYPEAPSGMPSVELGLPLMLDAHNRGKLSLVALSQLMSTGPARVWGIEGKGQIAEGLDADLVLVDLALEKKVDNGEMWTRSGWSAWHGTRLKGWPVQTILMGKPVMIQDRLVSDPLGEALSYRFNV
jgi:dihydroorotase